MGKVVSLKNLAFSYDEETTDKILSDAYNRSVGDFKSLRNAKRFHIDIKSLQSLLVNIVLSGAFSVNAIKKDASVKSDECTVSLDELSIMIGNTIYHKNISILEFNTVIEGPGKYYYQHDNIARDLLTLDSGLFEVALCLVCHDMRGTINNLVIKDDRNNIDNVIYYLKLYSTHNSSEFKYVSKLLEGIDSLDQFLVKFGYTNNDGSPSLETFKKACEEKIPQVVQFINNITKEVSTL